MAAKRTFTTPLPAIGLDRPPSLGHPPARRCGPCSGSVGVWSAGGVDVARRSEGAGAQLWGSAGEDWWAAPRLRRHRGSGRARGSTRLTARPGLTGVGPWRPGEPERPARSARPAPRPGPRAPPRSLLGAVSTSALRRPGGRRKAKRNALLLHSARVRAHRGGAARFRAHHG